MRFAWFLLGAPLFGQYLPNIQFSNLATSRNGQVLYFSSPLSLRGDDEQPYQKIFRIDSGGIYPAVQIERTGPVDVPNFSNFYLPIEPDLSGDGRVFSYVASRTCIGGSACVFFERYQSHVWNGGVETVYTGRTRLSRNGRYALRFGATGFSLPSDPLPQLIDLSTGQRTQVPGRILEGRGVASDGTVLTFVDNTLVLWKAGVSHPLALGANGRAVLSDNAAVIAVEGGTSFGQPLPLYLYEVASGVSTQLDNISSSYDASISDDGRLICYLRNSQVVLYDRIAKSEKPLSTTPDGVNEAVVSGDGSTIWEATGAGRLLRVDVASGNVQQVIARTPLITGIRGAPVPGSLNWVEGSGLSAFSAAPPAPLPESIPGINGGISLYVGSIPGRLFSVSPNEILYQIPFEMPAGTWRLSFVPDESPFDQPSINLQVVPYSPQPVTLVSSGETVIAHGDFSGLINNSSPAHPNEAIHVYFTGLGLVSPPLASGVPAPLDRLEPAVQGLNCQPQPVLFAGMAPGLVGIYQVDIRLPSQIPFINPNGITGFTLMECGDTSFSVPMEPGHN